MRVMVLMLRYHFGTVVFGSILTFIPEFFVGVLRKAGDSYPSWVRYPLCWLSPFTTFSKYCYSETVM